MIRSPRRRVSAAVAFLAALAVSVALAPPAAATDYPFMLQDGQRFYPGDALVSPSGRYRFEFDPGPAQFRVVERANWLAGERSLSFDVGGGEGVTSMSFYLNQMWLWADEETLLDRTGASSVAADFLQLQDDRELVTAYRTDVITYRFGTVVPPGLEPGQVLLPGDRTSGAGSDLVMQTDGNLVLYRGTRAMWSSGTWGHPGAGAVLQTDGNLVVYSSAATGTRPLWATGSAAPGGQLSARVDSDELTVWRPAAAGHDVAVWGSSWANSSLESGGRLDPGDRRTSPDGRCVLVMQADENLVSYCGGRPVFWTGAPPAAPAGSTTTSSAVMQQDGNLVVYRSTFDTRGTLTAVQPTFSTRTFGPRTAGSRTVVQSDGNVVVYRPDGLPVWSTSTGLIFRNTWK